MKKFISTFVVVLLVGFNSLVKAQLCPPTMPLIAGDTGYVYSGTGTTFNSGVTYNCNAAPFYIWANQTLPITTYTNGISNVDTAIFTPCISTNYNLYWTSLRNRGTESIYEGGAYYGCIGPVGCQFPIGGNPLNPNTISGVSQWDVLASYFDPTQSHDFVFTKPAAGAWSGPPTVTLRDCWNNATFASIVATPVAWPTGTTSFTATTAANTNIGFCSFTLSPAVAGAITDLKFGYVYVRPNLLPAGTYTMTYFFSGTDCPGGKTSQFVFTINNPYNAAWAAPTGLCTGGSCVSLPPTVSGTAGGTWSGTGVSGTNFCPATAGSGNFPVTYSVGFSNTCKATQTNTITVTATPTLTITGNTSICSGQSTILTGATATNYTWMPGSINTNTISVSPTSATVYTLTGANGTCSAVQTVATIVAATPTLNVTGGTICSGQSIVLTNTGTAASGYTWSPSGGSASSATVSPTSNQTYTLSGINGACTGTTTATVNVNATPTLSVAGGTICSGQNIVLTNTGTASGSYTWSPSGGSAGSATVSPSGNTTYTLSGANGSCTGTTTAIVNVNPTPTVSISSSSGTAICSGVTTTLTAGGATNYTWSANAGGGSAGTVTVSPGSTDTYTLTGDAAGCTSAQVITINVTPTPTVTAVATSATLCAGQSTIITGGGATGYTWMPGGLTTSTISVSPGTTTNYTLTGDNSGCTSTQTVTVNVNPLPVLTATANPASLCTGGTTTITASGASTYTWSANAGSATTNTVSITPASTDVYTVNATDANGCIALTQTVSVTVGAALTVTITPSVSNLCTGQTATLTATGATNYTWMPGGSTAATLTVNPSSNTTYSLAGDNGGCSGSTTLTLTVTTTPTVTSAASTTSICSSGSATLTAGGAANYTWMPGGATTGTITVSPSTTTDYTLTGETGGCSSTAVTTVSVSTTPTVGLSVSSATLCSGQSTVLTGSGAANYTWMPGGATTATNTVTPGTGTTTYTLTGANGACVAASQTVDVIVTATPTITNVPSSASICTGSSATLTASGATNYTWMPGGANTTTISVTPGTTTDYTLTGESGGCSSTAVTTVSVSTTPTVGLSVSTGTVNLCSGQSTVLTGSGATNYTWMPGGATTATNTVTPATGTTTYTLTGANGACAGSSQTVSITVIANPTVSISPSSNSICSNGNATLTAGGATNYTWMPGGTTGSSITVNPGTTTDYTLTGESGGCSNTGVATISVTPSPTLAITATSGTICSGTSTTLSAATATNYTWMPGGSNGSSISVNPASTTVYTVTGSNGACSNTVTSTVVVNPSPSVTAIPNIDSARCGVSNGGVHVVIVTGGTPVYTYQWYNGSTIIPGATLDSLTGVGIGTYSVSITDANGCTVSSTSATFSVPGSAGVLASISPITSQGQSPVNVTFTNNSTGALTYSWSFGNGSFSTAQNPSQTFTGAGTYTVIMTASSIGNCFDTDTAYVTVDEATSILIPNIFSPNGDNLNDIFFITTTGMKTLHCDIFNRWGTRMYTLQAPNQIWDGKTPNGESASEGTYYYILDCTGYDGKTYTKQGPLTLVR